MEAHDGSQGFHQLSPGRQCSLCWPHPRSVGTRVGTRSPVHRRGDGIPLGVSFVKVLREEVAQCGVLLAVIGPNWFDMRDEDGIRRLDNPTDFVRIEIAAALQREIPVIPILLDGMSVRPEMCTDGSIGYSSPRRKRGSRACPWPEQGASAAALVPGFLLSQE